MSEVGMGYEQTAAGRAMLLKRAFPCQVAVKRYRQAVKEGKAPKRYPEFTNNSFISYRNVDGDYTLVFCFRTPPEALQFAKQWGVERDFLKKGSK